MASSSVEAQNLAGGGDFEPLGHGFFRFDAFGTSHKFNSIAKERGFYAASRFEASAIFLIFACRALGPLRAVGVEQRRHGRNHRR
jgi:hypothetical protein